MQPCAGSGTAWRMCTSWAPRATPGSRSSGSTARTSTASETATAGTSGASSAPPATGAARRQPARRRSAPPATATRTMCTAARMRASSVATACGRAMVRGWLRQAAAEAQCTAVAASHHQHWTKPAAAAADAPFCIAGLPLSMSFMLPLALLCCCLQGRTCMRWCATPPGSAPPAGRFATAQVRCHSFMQLDSLHGGDQQWRGPAVAVPACWPSL